MATSLVSIGVNTRLIQKATGYRATVVSGVVTFEDGEATGGMPGKLIRGPQAAPALLAAE